MVISDIIDDAFSHMALMRSPGTSGLPNMRTFLKQYTSQTYTYSLFIWVKCDRSVPSVDDMIIAYHAVRIYRKKRNLSRQIRLRVRKCIVFKRTGRCGHT